jgi:hypothetical protein
MNSHLLCWASDQKQPKWLSHPSPPPPTSYRMLLWFSGSKKDVILIRLNNRYTVFQIRTETFSISLSILYSGGWYTIFFCIVIWHSLLNLNFVFLTQSFQNVLSYFYFWPNCFRIYGVIFVFDLTVSEFMGLFLFLTQLFQNLWGYFCFWPNCFSI